jgi:GNAT superfamily N-acetyltransferase
MVRQDSVDLTLSRVMFKDGQPVGVALVARRGWTSRLAAMSIVPEARGHGCGEECVRQLLEEARTRGDKAMTLEVIEQNTPAARLYEKCGFRILRRLVGYNGQIPPGEPLKELESVDLREVASALIAHGPEDLPWQISGETLAQSGPPSVGYHMRETYAAISDPSAEKISIRAILTLPPARRWGNAAALLRAISAHHPGKTWRVSPIFPEEICGLFEKLGMERDMLTQRQMRVAI